MGDCHDYFAEVWLCYKITPLWKETKFRSYEILLSDKGSCKDATPYFLTTSIMAEMLYSQSLQCNLYFP